MDVDYDLDGDVDFDFFDDGPKDNKAKSPSPRPGKSTRENKLTPTDKPVLPTNKQSSDEKIKRDSPVSKNTKVNGESPKANTTSKKDEDDYSSDSYSSDDLSTSSDSDSDASSTYRSDVSSVRSGTRARNRSRSNSDSSAYSRSPTPEKSTSKSAVKSNKSSKGEIRKKEEQQSQYSSDSDSYSDSDQSDSDTPRSTPIKDKKSDKHSKHRSPSPVEEQKASRCRPVSAHPRRRQNGVHFEAWGNERNNRPASGKSDRKKNIRNGDSKKKYRSDSDSESDMTDVSPLTSPRESPQKHDKRSHDSGNRLKKPVQYQSMPLPGEDTPSFPIRRGETETLDLNILMKAVSELEKKKRVKENSRRVMFAPVKPNDKANYTFNDDRTRVIERENQRLLQQIMKHVAQQTEPHRVRKVQPEPIRRATPSAINRMRQQTKIEQENMALLKRLQTARPTRGMAREEQITQYQRTMLYGVPIATADEIRKAGRRSRPSSASSTLSQRSRSMNSVHSASTVTSAASTVRSSRRPGSAKKYQIVDSRPDWSDRW